jgi:predicted alpha/beta-fold hydrolase
MFVAPTIQQQAFIRLIAPTHGGHCGFFQTQQAQEDRYWAENRIIEIVTGVW